MKRRNFVASLLAALGIGNQGRAASGQFEVIRSTAEWKSLLTDAEYRVMRREGTERPHSSPLNTEKRAGVYSCKGCGQALYASEHKFDSGTGWPSFYQALPDAIGTKTDRKLLVARTECHCARCGSHLGHIFNDGPRPTGKRHCINGVCLSFRAT